MLVGLPYFITYVADIHEAYMFKTCSFLRTHMSKSIYAGKEQ